jgi:hypothetical protein
MGRKSFLPDLIDPFHLRFERTPRTFLVFFHLVKRLSFPKPSPIRGVHLQQANRHSANLTAPDNKDSIALEVLFPLVQPWIKQPDERAAFRVKPTQVRSFVCIAVVTGESEISVVVTSAMLASDDVFDVIDEEWLRVLWKAAVFAAVLARSRTVCRSRSSIKQHGLQPRAAGLSLAEWRRNFRHGSLPHTHRAPQG